MDGLSDDSPWLPLILAIDCADRIIHGDTLPIFLLCVIFAYLSSLGSWLDPLLTLIFLALGNGALVTSWIRNSAAVQTAGGSVFVVLASWLIFSRIRSALNSRDDVAWKGPGRPYLIPCRTSHTRVFPTRHSFSYSYLVVGAPVGYKGNVNGIVSIDEPEQSASWPLAGSTKGWCDVNALDYLQSGHSDFGLRGKLDSYVRSQDVDPSDYPHAYLVTAARFLGYHFNPVSFWYLYSSEKVLSAIVLEVNNTFGERRSYLVLRDFEEEAKHISDGTLASSNTAPPRVKGSWPKDFHVSPFNSRKGSYSLLASDPLGTNMEGFRGVDVTISLSSSKGHPKLVARLFSDGEAVDPSIMGNIQKLRFLMSWFWVGFVTFPRILKEAAVLFFKRKLHVWYRPEPLKQSLGRLADGIERDLEGVFRSYVQFLVGHSPKPLSGPQRRKAEHVEIRVLTPVFYSRFVHYAHDFEGIFSELTENGTIWVDKPHVLPDIFLKRGSSPLHASGFTDFACFKLIQNLRRRPERIRRVLTSAEPAASSTRAVDVRDFRISSMDAYVLEEHDRKLKAAYRSALLRLFIADHFFMGSTELLTAVELVGHVGLAWISAAALSSVMTNAR
ncbi:Uncharacterized protein TPAR_00771 [Tolypocladium paradoxum]|uniref:Cyclopropane-fatty-acyl-phospholipid synthase n=1 Tax=Tolypocladium paradoxum TaxID=94208 RepID=A0A2S4L9D4_9HYPO|nr:Uncharacterized protein TPAR_00771 [Tolypocladium paradoxum]